MMDRPSWDVFFLGLASYYATRSKDPSTKVGAVLVRPDRTPAGMGYNGFPRGMPDDPELYANRDEKYSRVVHAEMNAIANSRDPGMQGYSLYSTLMPCDRCLVQAANWGIKRFVFPMPTDDQLKRWMSAFDKTRKYASEMGLELLEIKIED